MIMKKIIPTLSLTLIALLFAGCSSDLTNNEDAALTEQVLGKWKLTASYSDDQPANTPISNGYDIEFKEDNIFVSNEDGNFTGGTYTILNTPGKNLRLIYKKQWDAKVVYKYLNQVNDQTIYLQPSNPEPTEDGAVFFTGDVLTRVP